MGDDFLVQKLSSCLFYVFNHNHVCAGFYPIVSVMLFLETLMIFPLWPFFYSCILCLFHTALLWLIHHLIFRDISLKSQETFVYFSVMFHLLFSGFLFLTFFVELSFKLSNSYSFIYSYLYIRYYSDIIIHLFIRILIGLVPCFLSCLAVRYFFIYYSLFFIIFSCLLSCLAFLFLLLFRVLLLNCTNSVLFLVCSLTAHYNLFGCLHIGLLLSTGT